MCRGDGWRAKEMRKGIGRKVKEMHEGIAWQKEK